MVFGAPIPSFAAGLELLKAKVRAAQCETPFLEIAAKALNHSLLGFNLAREGDLRQMGLLYYAAASSETLGDALDRAQRYSSIANESVVLKCFVSHSFRIGLHPVPKTPS